MDVIKQYLDESLEAARALIPSNDFELEQANNDGKLKKHRISPNHCFMPSNIVSNSPICIPHNINERH